MLKRRRSLRLESLEGRLLLTTPPAVVSSNNVGLVGSFDTSSDTFQFSVSQACTTTAVVLDSEGQMIRTLWSLQPTSAGTHTSRWDGLDDSGQAVPPGDYSIRMIANDSTYTNVGAIGNSADSPSPADHTPVALSSVAVGPDGSIYTANAWEEEGADFKVWNAAGQSMYDAGFQIRNGTPYGIPYAIATDAQYFYCAVEGLYPNTPDEPPQLIERFRTSDGSAAPWSNGDPNGHIEVYSQIPAGQSDPLVSMATSSDSLWVVDTLGNRLLQYDKATGTLISQYPVQQPDAVAVDAAGQIWVGHGNNDVGILSLKDGSISDVITNLVQVVSLSFGPDGNLYIADTGAGQVKIFNVQGNEGSLVQSIGQEARPGDRAASDFYDLLGASVGPDGSIVTIQKEPPDAGSRLAKFYPNGTLDWEQYGNEFVGIGTYAQDDPGVLLTDSFHAYDLTNETTGAWTYANNTYSGQITNYSQSPTGVPRILHYGDADFYFEPSGDGLQVYRIEGNILHLAALVGGKDPGPDGTDTAQGGEWSWSDVDGTGVPTAGEIQWFGQGGSDQYVTRGMEVDDQGNIFFEDQFTGQIWEIPIGPPDDRGNPTYNWADRVVILPKDQSSLGLQPQSVQHADDGSYYVLGWTAANPDPNSPLWMGGSTLVKFDADGQELWAVKLPEICTGMDLVPGGGVMLGGGVSATIYQFASDGMLIGSMSPGAAMDGTSGWLDNQGSVAVDRNPLTGDLDVFAEDDYNMNIGWYQVSEGDIQEITVPNVTPVPVPAAPVDLSATPIQAGQIHLYWDAVAGSVGYVVDQNDGDGNWRQVIDLSPSATATDIAGLDPSTTYYFRVTSLETIDGFDQSTLGHSPLMGSYAVASATTAPSQVASLFQDDFSSGSAPGAAWSFPHGTWTVTASGLSQTSPQASQTKALIVDQAYPTDVEITAKVRVDSWANGDNNIRVGIGLHADGTLLGYGGGYFLTFDGDQHHVLFCNDEAGYGNSYDFNWNVGQWYWFKLEDVDGTLYGKIWADGTEEPSYWQFVQDGWTNCPNGAPALCGGSIGNSPVGHATATFNFVQVTAVEGTGSVNAIHLDTVPTAPGGSNGGAIDSDSDVINVVTPFVDGVSNSGDAITIYDETNGPGRGSVLGSGVADSSGNFAIQLVDDGSDPSFFATSASINDKIIGIQAADGAGTMGDMATFAYTLDVMPPMTPTSITLESRFDTGRSTSDDITNLSIPLPTAGSLLNIVTPVFDVATTLPATNPLTPYPIGLSVELLRSSTDQPGSFSIVATAASDAGGTVKLSDPGLAAIVAGPPVNAFYYYEAIQVDQAGEASAPSGILTIHLITTTPTTPGAPTLAPTSKTGIYPGTQYTNQSKPTFNLTTPLTAGDVVELFRSGTGTTSTTFVAVCSAPAGSTSVQDTSGVIPDGVYLYEVAQVDIAGNISALSPPDTVTVLTTAPAAPTINLLAADDTGLPTHPNVTSDAVPQFFGTAPYNAAPNSLPVAILNVTGLTAANYASGTVLTTTFPTATGTYQTAKLTAAIPDGVYTLVARVTNLAGTVSYSAPLTVTIQAATPSAPTLVLLPADDTGIKGDGTTANHDPRFTGFTAKADYGDTVTLYAIINGVLSAPEATATSSTVNGSFTFQLSSYLTDGTKQFVARVSDNANNVGPLSPVLNVRIITVQGDYHGTGAAQLTIFDPNTETYFVQNGNSFTAVQADPGSSYRDIPIQYDFNGDGKIDYAAYRFNTATFFGSSSNGSAVDIQYGLGGVSLPIPDYFQPNGTFTLANYGANSGYWADNLPQPGGLVVKLGVNALDIPVPAAYDGFDISEIAVFRPSAFVSPLGSATSDADSFSVLGPNGYYQISFTSPAVAKLGFVYKAGDIPAPADYDGVGHDEFAIYRPSTGQFFILNTPSVTNTATWTLRTVTMNLPGGPSVNDVPVSEDYDGNGKVDPTVYRPSNSTFYILHSSTGIQQNVPFGLGNFDIAAAGPLKYRLTALKGPYASNGGYPSTTASGKASVETPTVHIESIASASSSSTSSSAPVASLVAVASPMVLTTTKTTAPTIAVPTPAPASTVTLASSAIATVPIITAVIPSTSTTSPASITIGSSAAKTFVPTVIASKKETTTTTHGIKETKAKKPAATHTVEPKAAKVEPKTATTLDVKPVALHPKAKAKSTSKTKTPVSASLRFPVSARKCVHKT